MSQRALEPTGKVVHTCGCAHLCVHKHVCMHVCLCVCTCVLWFFNVYVCMCVHMCPCVHMCMCVYSCAYSCACVCMCTHVTVCMCVCTCISVCPAGACRGSHFEDQFRRPPPAGQPQCLAQLWTCLSFHTSSIWGCFHQQSKPQTLPLRNQ